MSDELLALVFLFLAPVMLGGLFWVMILLEERTGRVPRIDRTPFDPPPFDPPPWW